MPHTTELPYTPHRAQHSPIEPLDRPIEDSRGHYGSTPPHRAIDILERLETNGVIDHAMRQAGQAFHDLFHRAALDPLHCADLGRGPSSGRARPIVNRIEDARAELAKTMRRLGGYGSLAGSCAWSVLGLEMSLRSWAIEKSGIRPTGKDRINDHEARGVLRSTLQLLQK